VGSLNCLSRLFRDLPYTCTMNPALGHEIEPEYQVTPAAVKKKIMVVGAGPAGLECAITAAKRGHDVVVCEKGDRLGGNLVAYASNDLARVDDLMSIVRHYEVMTRKLGIEVRLGTEVTPKFMRSVLHQYDVAVVAAGARIDRDRLQSIDGAHLLLDAVEVAHGRAPTGREVVVIGGGKIGLVVAEALAQRGAKVTIVEREKRIASDVMPSFKWRHSTWVDELGIETVTQARVTKVTAESVHVVLERGIERVLAADTVIAAAPRRPNQELFHEFEWMIDEVHGCGDALVPRGLDAAISEGFRLGARL
jgi:2,4-dienoyl-CoA reductase (NADPH2)